MKRTYFVIALTMVMSLIFAACAPQQVEVIRTVEVPVVETQVVKEIETIVETRRLSKPSEVPSAASGLVLPRQ